MAAPPPPFRVGSPLGRSRAREGGVAASQPRLSGLYSNSHPCRRGQAYARCSSARAVAHPRGGGQSHAHSSTARRHGYAGQSRPTAPPALTPRRPAPPYPCGGWVGVRAAAAGGLARLASSGAVAVVCPGQVIECPPAHPAHAWSS